MGVAAEPTCRVVAVDVGSVKSNFAWAALDVPDLRRVDDSGISPEGAAQNVAEALRRDVPVALGFECPLTIPVPTDEQGWATLGRARDGEGNRPWSAGAGSGALATGLAQAAWICQRIVALTSPVDVTSQPEKWLAGRASLLLWEAFVSGRGKPARGTGTQHDADARAAVQTFGSRLAAGTLGASDVTCAPHGAFNLGVAAAMYAGMVAEPDELRLLCQVYRSPAVAG